MKDKWKAIDVLNNVHNIRVKLNGQDSWKGRNDKCPVSTNAWLLTVSDREMTWSESLNILISDQSTEMELQDYTYVSLRTVFPKA